MASIGLDALKDGTHTIRRTCNLRAVQLLLGNSKIESTVRYIGIEIEDTIDIAEKFNIQPNRAGIFALPGFNRNR